MLTSPAHEQPQSADSPPPPLALWRPNTFTEAGVPDAWRYEGAIPGGIILYVHYLADEDAVFADVFGDDLSAWTYDWEGEAFDGWHIYSFVTVDTLRQTPGSLG